MKTEAQALRDLSQVVADALAESSQLTPLEAARRAWRPSGPSVEELAARITANRARLAPTT